ncbi:hypothetical protein CFE70_004096 [Pyrenophora teres f. teres 0-1]
MLAFTHFFASALAFHLADTAGLWPWKTAEQEELCSVYEQQAFLAANEQIRVAESLLRFSGFKNSSERRAEEQLIQEEQLRMKATVMVCEQ